MSDNISPDEVKRRLILFLSIPAEVWTDVLKLLPRRILVKNIAPACFRFKEICDKNVKNVHMIKNANQFAEKLEEDNFEANQKLENLAANECQLASQIKLSKVRIAEKSQAILSYCPDLFNGCKISLYFGFGEEENKNSTFFLECLNHLEKAEPVEIYVSQDVDQVIDYWHHPTILNCGRIDLNFWSDLPAETMMNILAWLHHQPNGVDCDDSAVDQQVRSMIFWGSRTGQNHIEWLINRCAEDVQQSKEPADRRQFVFSFDSRLWDGQFRQIENKATGEVLLLDRVLDANGQSTRQFRLRRCLAEEEASGQELYAGMFKRDEGYDEFKIDENKPKVMIG